MAKFILQQGERVIHRQRITTTTRDRHEVPGELVLTDQRIVLLQESRTGIALLFFGVLGGLVSALTSPSMSHEIWRGEFSRAEVTGGDELRVRSKGEGYAVTWFDVRPVGFRAARSQAATEWSDRLHQWASGTIAAAPLPSAKIVQP